MEYPPNTPLWIECDMCEEWWCSLHDSHVFDCICPGIEELVEFGVDPYSTPKSDPKVLLAIAKSLGNDGAIKKGKA